MVDECEICGRTSNYIAEYKIEGALVKACQECGKFGTKIEVKRSSFNTKTATTFKKSKQTQTKTPPPQYQKKQKPKITLKEDFGNLVMDARKKEGLSRKDLAMDINERETLLARLESNEYRPDAKLIDKLERRLLIKLTEQLSVDSPVDFLTSSSSANLTLGDVVVIKKRKKKKKQ